jgi:membrane protein DedA with SNARE-associated domain
MTVDFTNFQQVASWVILHGYILVFLVMCFEGPIITAAAGFAAALGFFDPWLILLLSILGDLVPDSIYYFMGYTGRLVSIEKMMGRIGFTQDRADRLENLLRRHFRKTLVGMKFTPVIAPFGYMVIGYMRISFGSFIEICSAVTIPKSIIFLLIGYYFGQLYNINEYIHNIIIFIPIVVVLIFVLYFIYKAIADTIRKRVGKI